MVENGLDHSESNPQFHQQMVYAVAMKTIKNFEREPLLRREIQLDNHCFGCTAGAGSSCEGAIA